MRTFLVGMCDIFLLLYLTALTTYHPGTSDLTVGDFTKLKSMYAAAQKENKASEAELREKLRRALAQKETLQSRLTEEKGILSVAKQSLAVSDEERRRISEELKKKEEMLQSKEEQLAGLSKEIETREKAQQQMQQTLEEARRLAEDLTLKASSAEQLANRMQEEAAEAQKAAEAAKTIRIEALVAKEQALEERAGAEQKAAEALAASQAAETEKERALGAMKTVQANMAKAQQDAQKLTEMIQAIKQDGETAYKKKILPSIQKLNVTYESSAGDTVSRNERELDLLPVKLDGKTFVVFPSRQIGFVHSSDKAPDKLQIMYKDKKITSALINAKEDLIAVALPEVEGVMAPYPANTDLAELMPTLLALRNGGGVGLLDKLRGISSDYFIVSRDYLEAGKEGGIKFSMTGFRGTGSRGDRIVIGDQLVDLNGRLIGIANDAYWVVQIDTLKDWTEISF